MEAMLQAPVRVQNFIGGKFVDPVQGQWMETIEPATGKPWGQIPDSDSADVDAAVVAAAAATASWARTPCEQRANILLKVAALIDLHLPFLALAESKDSGKPLSSTRAFDIPRAAANFRFFATAILHSEEMAVMQDNGSVSWVLSQPLGVAGLISPWNFPFFLLTWKIAPAIATGNTCVCKPSEFTSVSAWLLCALLNEAGLPPGVCNLVFGLGAKVGQPLVEHPSVPLISFTGGTITGMRLAQTAGQRLKKCSLELGGKNATLIFADCDFERALTTTVHSSFLNQGEVCLSGERILVQRPIYERFLARFVAAASAWIVGDPEAEGTQVGALVSQQHLAKVLSYVALARSLGATVHCGGEGILVPGRCQGGYFFPPTILSGLPHNCRVNTEEIFGPVVTVAPFDTMEEAIQIANDTSYGLSASVFTQDVAVAHVVGTRLDVGMVWINTWLNHDFRVPYGGHKSSGIGREGGKFSLDFFTEKKTVCIQYDPPKF